MSKEDDVFWHPNIYEWRAYCELHPECDPKSTLLLKDGGYRFIPKEEAPLDEVAEGKRIQKERKEAEEKAAQAAAPKAPVVCPACGATTVPDASGCCEYCGGAVNG